MKPARHIHFIGIGGVGMSGLAQVAHARGAMVSGSDTNTQTEWNPALKRLVESRVPVYHGHDAANLLVSVDLVVASAAIGPENPEIRAARDRGIEVVSRAEYLGHLMEATEAPSVAVAGTHGKTTTTAMLGTVLASAGLEPTVFVGGEVPVLGGNVYVGKPDGPFIAEACEAYGSFLHLEPDIAVLTNVEPDHLDYYGTADRVVDGFAEFVSGAGSGRGTLIACSDDLGAAAVAARAPRGVKVITYGSDSGDSRVENITGTIPASFDWTYRDRTTPISLGFSASGKHNMLNAVGAATVASELGVAVEEIQSALVKFSGVERRLELLGESMLVDGPVFVVDDYAHLPTEIRATLAAVRAAMPGFRVLAVFQPHLYSRTRDFLPEFADALSGADLLFVTEIYAAREAPDPGVTAEEIVTRAVRERAGFIARYVPNKRDLPGLLKSYVRGTDVILFLGAGDIRAEAIQFVRELTDGGR